MKLQFKDKHLSIDGAFPFEIELGKLTIITGLNGSGKSHFLQALGSGALSTDLTKNPSADVKLFDWKNFVVDDVKPSNEPNNRTAIKSAYANIRNLQPNPSQLKNVLLDADISSAADWSDRQCLQLSIENIASLGKDGSEAKALHDNIRALHKKSTHVAFMSNLSSPDYNTLLPLAKILDKEVTDLTDDDIEKDILTASSVNGFQLSFVNKFVGYKNFYLNNQIKQNLAWKGKQIKSLTDEEFTKLNGEPPWDALNQAMADANLPFQINKPTMEVTDGSVKYVPKLTKNGTSNEIEFKQLSSGEKTLMTLATCVYYNDEARFTPNFPKLLLLDEIDAPLHPSMCRDMLNIIQKTLIEKQGLHVILTTHSPSTVAMAPDDSIYVMKSEDERLTKATKADALNLLTHGVPTLALNFDGRRQVITESADDAKICSALYEIFKKNGLRSDRSLEFLSIGSKSTKDNSDQNAGVDKALEVLGKFVAGGNQSVFALVDSDKLKRQPDPEKRIFVFGQGTRDGLENFIYDPLLLLVILARSARQQLKPAGLDEFIDTELSGMTTPQLQQLIDDLQNHILGPSDQTTKKTPIQYKGGRSLGVRDDYLWCDDHDLKNKIFQKFSSLKSNNEGFSKLSIVKSCLAAYPDFIPVEFYKTFENLLDADPHI